MKLFARISIILPLAVTLIWLQFLPEQVPLHYDFAGNIDRWGSKWENLLIPGIVLVGGVIAYFSIKSGLRKSVADEKQKAHAEANVKAIRIVMIATGVFFTVLQCVLLYAASREAFAKSNVASVDLNRVSTICMGIMFLVLGNILPKAKLNSLFGFRCGWTMFNDVTWQKSNRFSGYALMLAGLATVVCAILLPESWAIPCMLLLLTLLLIVCLFYAAKVYREEKAKE
ncbi:MAG: DUF1648 domain-containing protein [Oscillospiraceae bacterium]|nr:DUF1648 domain-containing protein [Oscillospiraceae bacterium]